MNEYELYQKIGELAESNIAINQRLERMEKKIDDLDKLKTLTIKIDKLEKDMEAIKTLPAKFITGVILAVASGVGSLILELLRK
jgi:DNA anti-recombination protein RmuC